MSTIRFRFTFNQGPAQPVQKQTSAAINGVVERVAFEYADKTYDRVKTTVVDRVRADAMTELSWMAGLFKRFVVGIGNGNTGPNGFLSAALEGSGAGRARTDQGIAWKSRTKRYMAWKQKHYPQGRWFANENQVIPEALGSAQNWISYFGPIEVRLQRIKPGGSTSANLGRMTSRTPYKTQFQTRYKSPEDSRIRVGVANISVAALTHITPGMLPGLVSGKMGEYAPDARRTGLMNMLPAPVAQRLGGRGAYRHTIEPFLTFYMTRAVPYALFLRIQRGLGATIDKEHRSR